MSYTDNRQTGPQIYHYANNSSIGSYIAPGQSTQPTWAQQQSTPEPITINQTSTVQPVNPTPTFNVQPTATQPNANNDQRNSQFRASRQEVVSSDKRFSNYNNLNEYKYNLFSLIDEPWNRCLQLGKCGSFPANECITRQARRGLWDLN